MIVFLLILAGAAIAASIVFLWLLAPGRLLLSMETRLSGMKYAHRGLFNNQGNAPENSMEAFRAAIDEGYGIELDVRLTKDGEVVVFHDGSLDRMCGLSASVSSMTLAELRMQRLLESDETIPLFGEFLSMVGGRVPLLVEFKTSLPGSDWNAAAALCSAAMALLDEYSGAFVIESFDYNILKWFRQNRPGVMRGQLAMGLSCYVPALGKRGALAIPAYRRVMLSFLLYNFAGRPHFISYRFEDAGICLALCRALGARVSVWTVRTALDAVELLKRYDAIIFEGFNA